ncbi:malto-oligosyltrehalose trehalohydrolase, partial [Pseudomonas aeruginosa]
VPDPASQFQPDGVHGHSQVLDHGAYAWRVDEWRGRPWHEAVIYELHVGLFGSYAEVEHFLPRLVELGVTAVELMPLGEFPGRRNWGYDGVLPFAPASAYGTPEQLKHLIDSAHGMGLMVFVDVIYNHFGPDGNYLAQYAAAFFRDDRQTPWGQAIDFRRGEVREFFYENALMWLLDYRVDGLRFDAVHAIPDSAFLVEMARRLRGAAGPERHLHLVLENDDNRASLLRQGYDAQWNDDGHHALHVLLTGENDGYYQDYPEPLRCLARCLAEGFVYQGEANRHGRPRGEPSADLAPDAFVLFLQNHDQVGNRAFGERLSVLAEPQALRLAIALQLLAPMIPLLFMGEECAAREPFLYFTDHQGELADAVREGRRKEFGEFGRFGEGATLASLPDPNAVETFERSRPG